MVTVSWPFLVGLEPLGMSWSLVAVSLPWR
jgi:hypothetical protein